MKTKRLCSLVLVVVMLMNFSIPIAHAAGAGDISSSESAIIVEGQSYLAHGEEDSEKRFNIIINAETREGQFAVVYLDEPDYLYEHFFNMEDLQNAGVDMDWTDVEEFCFAQETEWNEIYIPTAVTCIKYPDNSIMQEGEGGIAPATVNATGDDPIEYFEGWLEEQHGSEYSGQPVSSKTQNGTTMHLKSAFQTYVYRNQTFLFSVAVSVAGFITGFLGRIVSATRLATFSFLVGTAGLFTAGSSVDEYILRANWFKYATLGVGTGYPYGLTDKFIHYYGYQYSRSGNFDIDEEAAETSYVPSAEVYNNNSKVYDAAFEEYARIGWQDGNF